MHCSHHFAICTYLLFDYLHGVLQLSQLGHNSNWICLSHFFLNFRIVYAHEDVMLLLVTYCELSLGFFVVVGEALQILHCGVLRNRYTKFDITFCIFVTGLYCYQQWFLFMKSKTWTYVDFGVVRQGSEDRIQCFMHLLCITLEETSTSPDEQSVPSKNCPIISVFHVITDRVLSMTWCVESSHFDVIANFECRIVCWCFRDLVAILTTNDWQWILFELRKRY